MYTLVYINKIYMNGIVGFHFFFYLLIEKKRKINLIEELDLNLNQIMFM
jgi:hypothetical protein